MCALHSTHMVFIFLKLLYFIKVTQQGFYPNMYSSFALLQNVFNKSFEMTFFFTLLLIVPYCHHYFSSTCLTLILRGFYNAITKDVIGLRINLPLRKYPHTLHVYIHAGTHMCARKCRGV